MANRQTEEKITVLYERLSRDDDLTGDSNSILNQKRYLESYAAQRGYTNIVHYTDDGWSGGNFDRPAWKRLVADIEAGKVAHLLCKDLSRIGRNYLQTGFYTEVMFRQNGVHFVAVANNIDSEEQDSGEFAPFLNIMNEWYLRDQSKKVSAAYRVKGKAGKPTTNNAIYGYKKDPEDKDHWLVDEEAAAVVRRIFRLAVEGHGPHEIAKILTQEKVECPAYYLARNGRGSRKNTVDTSRPYDWYGFTVSSMLIKPEYMGHTVNFRSSKKSYRDKRVKNDPSDWLIFENTHEAIVDPETWQLAQQVKRTVRRTDTTGVANPLTGLVFCADCGAKMYNHRGKRKKAGREYSVDFYSCSTYTLTFERETQMCSSHTVSTKALNALILETIRTTASYAIQNKEEFIQKVCSILQVRQQEAAKELKRKVAKERRRSAELDVLIKKLYETYAMGKLEEKRFELLCAEYEKEQAELEQLLASEQAQLDQFHEDQHPSMKLNKRYFYCFGCGATGDVIDLVARLFGLNSYEAAQKLAQDFGIDPDKPPAAISLPKPERPLLKVYRQEEVHCLRVLCDYLHLLESWKVQYAPKTPADTLDDRFVEACQMLDYVEYLADLLIAAELEQRVKIVEMLNKDGMIAGLEERLDRLKKEDGAYEKQNAA